MAIHSHAARIRVRRSQAIAAAVGLLALASNGCEKMPLLAPSGSAITFTEGASSAVSTDTVTISVLVQEAGSPTSGQNGQTTPAVGGGTPVHDGTTVRFSVTRGTMDPVEARTIRGRTTVTFVGDGGGNGEAVITASSGPATKTLKINLTAPPPEATVIR